MPTPARRLSLFSQDLDRVAFLVYFLGAVVPLGALAIVTHRYALPALGEGAQPAAALAGLAALACLSLGAFLALRRATRAALARRDLDNRRLETLLEASRTLAAARAPEDVSRAAARAAVELTGAGAALVFTREAEKDEGAPHLVATAGDAGMELFRAARARIEEVVLPVLEQGVPALLREETAGAPLRALAAVPVAGTDGAAAALAVVSGAPGAAFDASHLRSLGTVAALASVARANADLRDAQRNFFVHVTEILIAALDAHQDEQEGHARRVAHVAVRIGRELGFDDRRLERLHFAALLHDVGMLKLDTGREKARAGYKGHPVLGHRMLSRIRLWDDLAPMVLHHHERWDGSGYPEGLAGEEIPLEARIIAVAEAFDSMAAPSRWQPGRPFEEALRAVGEGRGKEFDPRVADVFLELAARGVIEAPEARRS